MLQDVTRTNKANFISCWLPCLGLSCCAKMGVWKEEVTVTIIVIILLFLLNLTLLQGGE